MRRGCVEKRVHTVNNISATIRYASRWLLAAGLCLAATGCSYRQGVVNGQAEHLLRDDHTDLDNTRRDYRYSVNESGMDSEASQTMMMSVQTAERKLEVDQRQFDNYKSASGQSSVPRE